MTLSDLMLGQRPAGRTALTARWIVAHQDGHHRLLENGEIVIDAGEELTPKAVRKVGRTAHLDD